MFILVLFPLMCSPMYRILGFFFFFQSSIGQLMYSIYLVIFFFPNRSVFYRSFTSLHGIRAVQALGFTGSHECCSVQVELIATILCPTSRPSLSLPLPFISQFTAFIAVIFFSPPKEISFSFSSSCHILLQSCLKHLSPPTPLLQQLLSAPGIHTF